VALLDETTGVVDTLSETSGEDDGLETTIKELFNFETEDIVELLFRFGEETETSETTEESGTFEETLGVLLRESEEVTSDGTNLGESVVDAVNFTLVAET
jgi:hypothetical protein